MPKDIRPVLAVSMGEPAGIGPELALRVAANPALRRAARFLLVGDPAVFAKNAARLGLRLPPLRKNSARAGETCIVAARGGAGAALDAAIALVRKGEAHALVTAPLDKARFHAEGYPAQGHTAYLERVCGVPQTMMAFVPACRSRAAGRSEKHPAVALHSVHVPLREALRLVTRARLLKNLLFLDREWKKLFGRKPRIAVAGLNPHAGEGGLLGNEERRDIAPAVADARKRGVRAEGPFAPDTVFYLAARDGFDVVFALYHDQGLIAAKAAGVDGKKSPFHYANLTLGLPFVRTSPDHGVAYDLAGTGRASLDGMAAAVRLAARLARRGA